MKIIVINGSAESGKDSFVDLVKKHASCEVINISSIDPVKRLMRECGWDAKNDKSDEARACMAEIKAVLIDRLDGGFWYVSKKLDEIRYFNPDAVVFVHVREPDEIQKLKWAFGKQCSTLIVYRDVRVPNNSADQNVHNFDYDIQIENNGSLSGLEIQALSFVTYLEGTETEMALAA